VNQADVHELQQSSFVVTLPSPELHSSTQVFPVCFGKNAVVLKLSLVWAMPVIILINMSPSASCEQPDLHFALDMTLHSSFVGWTQTRSTACLWHRLKGLATNGEQLD
jgi:hypothetical protein